MHRLVIGQRSILPIGLPALAVILLCSSCNRSPARKPIFPIKGRVSFQSKATPGAMVVFHPLHAADRYPTKPHARVGNDGTFTLSTYEANDGGPAGEYVVTVTWRKRPSDDEEEDGPNLLPERYAQPATSPLRVVIHERQNLLEPFDLTR